VKNDVSQVRRAKKSLPKQNEYSFVTRGR
jgi:hypothetical protein